ncbi:MAG: tRNA epoxyqueuosine(34) reductase QueG [Phycisphaerae bacterium]|jgi:epoxyqueuosine reductase
MNGDELAQTIKRLARRMGFAAAGITGAGSMPRAERLHTWLDRGYDAGLAFMRRNLAGRLCPSELLAGAQSVICLAVGYAPATDGEALVARFARGQDYHAVLKARCRALMEAIRAAEPNFSGRAFGGSAPLMARSLAAAAGLGWIGHNGCLLVPGFGSYCVLAEIVCNLPLPPDEPIPNRCGDCRACLAACPTGALQEDGLVDARRCISYLTIEHRGGIDPALWPRMGVRLFGCDACQAACPHNRNLPAGDAELTSAAPLGGAGLANVLGWDEAAWQKATEGSAMRRITWDQFLRNAILAAGNSGDSSLVSRLRVLQAAGPDQAALIRWALARLGEGDKSFDSPGGQGV